jgi:hypothetical protein
MARASSLKAGTKQRPRSGGSLPHPSFDGIRICQETDAVYKGLNKDKDKNKGHVVEFKTLEVMHCDPRPQHAKKLGQYVRQMAVSQTLLRETHSGSFLVMIGRDHRMIVLEDTGTHEAFDWLKNDFNYWFRFSKPHAAFLKQFLGVVAPYTQECERRK